MEHLHKITLGDFMKISTLSKKQVVSRNSGEMLGKITDLEFNPATYQINAVIVKKRPKHFFSLFINEPHLILDTNRIESIGSDVVLIDSLTIQKKSDKHK